MSGKLGGRAGISAFRSISRSIGLVLAWTASGSSQPASAQGVHVWTYHNDNARTGQNLNEKTLTPANVKTKFGKLRTLAVDGNVYAQPLYLSGVPIDGSNHNVVYIATQNDSLFAYDADTGVKLKFKSFLTGPGVTPIPVDPDPKKNIIGNFDIVPKIGITGTPVIAVDPNDVGQSTLYVVAKTQEVAGTTTTYVQRLHALDVTTLEEKPKSPSVSIEASVPGSGNGSNDPADANKQGDNDDHGHVHFDPLRQHQRAGLLLLDGVVYVGWASHGDQIPYHGWLIGFDARTLAAVAVFNTTPNGGRAGIWQAGAAPAADARGNIYVSTGNGSFDGQWDPMTGVLNPGTLDPKGFPAKSNYGDSVLKLARDKVTGALVLVDYFTPFNQNDLSGRDMDLGSGGLVLLPDQNGPHPHRMVMAGKQGVIYLLDCDDLGKFSAPNNPKPVVSPDRVLQRIPTNPQHTSPIGLKYGLPAYFNNNLYHVATPLNLLQGEKGPLKYTPDFFKQFAIVSGLIQEAPASRSKQDFGQKYSNTPSISANVSSDGIVWVIRAEGYQPGVPATLYAFDASDLGNELYNSNMAGARDQPGMGLKFTVPTIADGKVFVGTQSEVTVYGLLNP
jgi:hypothetical protein